MDQHLTYEQAFAELQAIEAQLANETVTLSELAEKMKRASFLVQYCTNQLRATETEVNQILDSMGVGE